MDIKRSGVAAVITGDIEASQFHDQTRRIFVLEYPRIYASTPHFTLPFVLITFL